MLVYHHGSPAKLPAEMHVLFVSPAAHLADRECPRAWVDERDQPRTFVVEFRHGTAEVDDHLERYLLDTKQAEPKRLVVSGPFS